MHEDSLWIWIGVPDVDIVDFGGKKVFIVQRYERVIGGTSIKRLHQEDFCQALGLMSEQKYESDGGPGIAAIFNLIKKNFLDQLLISVIFLRWLSLIFLLEIAIVMEKIILFFTKMDWFNWHQYMMLFRLAYILD